MTDFYRDVARIALAVADKHGFVLGGGVAWLVNGLVQRPTEDVDLFTDAEDGVVAATGEVSAALITAGYSVALEEPDGLFAGMDDNLREFLVAGGDRALRLTLCRLDRHRAPVVMDVGPVMHLDDEDVADAGRYLDRVEDDRFAVYGFDPPAVARLRAALASWPR
ncbi:MAG TPA: nucleotidyl transferase AbiEii/AbiGii toxin family protein [Actinoplanes sp.]|nr:nucleotidyl transferase AbiEii/AbiGii toxin family protein [Actinoplanes sp.]